MFSDYRYCESKDLATVGKLFIMCQKLDICYVNTWTLNDGTFFRIETF